MQSKKPKLSDTFMHLRCDKKLKAQLKVEASSEGRTLSNYVFDLINEGRKDRQLSRMRAIPSI